MKTSFSEITVIDPFDEQRPNAERRHQIHITNVHGELMVNRLRSELRDQDRTKNFEPDKRYVVCLPNELVLEIVTAYRKKTKAMSRMDKALDLKSRRIQKLEADVRSRDTIIDDCIGYKESCSLLIGALGDLLDVATDFRAATIVNKCNVPEASMKAMESQIAEASRLLDDLQKESEKAAEEEK